MKRKSAMVLCMAACMGLLFGCGQKETMGRLEKAAETMAAAEDDGSTPENSGQMSETEGEPETETTSAVSEYLGEGKKILYRIRLGAPDKERIPEYIYFFEDGRVTYLLGTDLNLTMGELSKMTDEDIWAKMEECRKAKYDALSDTLQQLKENKLKAGITYMQLNLHELDIDSFVNETLQQMYMAGATIQLPAYSTADDTQPEYWEEWADTFPGGQEEIRKTGEEVCAQMESSIAEMKDWGRNIPTAFIVETDATGNNVEDEGIVWMAEDGTGRFMKIVIERKITTGRIYDSDYACYPADSNDTICVRDDTEIIFDEIGSDKVYVDVPIAHSDVQALFQ